MTGIRKDDLGTVLDQPVDAFHDRRTDGKCHVTAVHDVDCDEFLVGADAGEVLFSGRVGQLGVGDQ